MTELCPITTWSTSGSTPASSSVLPITSAHIAAFIDGLKSTVLPAARAAASLRNGSVNGKFHGVMSATTPNGSTKVNTSSSASVRKVLPRGR